MPVLGTILKCSESLGRKAFRSGKAQNEHMFSALPRKRNRSGHRWASQKCQTETMDPRQRKRSEARRLEPRASISQAVGAPRNPSPRAIAVALLGDGVGS